MRYAAPADHNAAENIRRGAVNQQYAGIVGSEAGQLLLYTGVRVSELINIKLSDVDFQRCQIRVNQGKGKKDRIVPFPSVFKELLAMHANNAEKKGAVYLFESSWKKNYTDRGIRKILKKYSDHGLTP